MSSFESNKSLAGIGALLLALGSVVPVIGIVGIILLLIGMKGLSENYGDPSIYQNALWGTIYGIIGLAAAAVVLIAFIFTGAIFAIAGLGLVAVSGAILAVVLLFVFYLLAAINFRRAFNTLAQRTGEHMFETAGLLLWIGAILTIIVVGLLLVFVAWILATVAFFSTRTQPSAQTPMYTPPPPTPAAAPAPSAPPAAAARYCSNCGRPLSPDDKFCPNCGKEVK